MIKIEFADYQLVYVVAGVWLLCCFRQFLTCCNVVCCDSESITKFCQQQIGCNEYDMGSCLRGVILFFSLLQPVFLIVVQIAQSINDDKKYSSLQFQNNAKLLTCEFHNTNNETQIKKIHISDTIEVDFVVLAFLSALCQSLSCYCWLMCQQYNYLSSTSLWNNELHENMQFYELVYFMETFCASLACLSVIANWTSLAELMFCNSAICFILFHFLVYSKIERSSNLDIFYSSIFMLLLIVSVFFVLSRMKSFCIISSITALLYVSCIALNVNVHYISDANFLASTILCVRISISILLSTLFLCITIIGIDTQCAHTDDICLSNSNWPQLNNWSTANT